MASKKCEENETAATSIKSCTFMKALHFKSSSTLFTCFDDSIHMIYNVYYNKQCVTHDILDEMKTGWDGESVDKFLREED